MPPPVIHRCKPSGRVHNSISCISVCYCSVPFTILVERRERREYRSGLEASVMWDEQVVPERVPRIHPHRLHDEPLRLHKRSVRILTQTFDA